MIVPMDARVVVKKPTRQEQTASGIILPDTVDEGTQTSQGEVVAVGPGSRNMNNGEPMEMDIKVGDKILYTKYQGVEVKHNGEEFFIIMERDVIAKIDIQKIIEFHEKNENKITMAVRVFENKIPFGTVNLSNSKVESIKEKPITRHFVNTGIYVIDPSVLRNIKKNQPIDMTTFIQNCINKKIKVGAYILHEDWMDVGRKEEYLKANKLN